MQKVPMTVEGAEKLKDELKELKQVERPKVIADIAEARAHGDLKENAEYHAARERQSFIEGRIIELESKLSNAQVVDVTRMENEGRVIFGATIHLQHVEGNIIQYRIVGEDEADLKDNKISVTSPVARAMIGKFEGDVIEVTTPEGTLTYEIIEVHYI